mmetsp:Transcript_112237/g.250753  ORF Transcript_112237/g.250753 Transcript_112237/m.250753 type:complete len:578 (-) Transcript_112237:68-1801(-)
MAWGTVGALLIAYDVLMVPMIAFKMEASSFSLPMAWITAVFWTLDMALQLITGFHTEGVVEMRLRHIRKRYLSTWFIPDFLVLLVDWVGICAGFGGQASNESTGILRIGKSSRLLKPLRFLRFVRLMRVAKVTETLDNRMQHIHSAYLALLMKVSWNAFKILVINHYIACAWYLIATENEPDPPTWITRYVQDDGNCDFWDCYTRALHWSLTQVTPATQNIGPVNPQERFFAIGVVLFGLITFSSFLGSLTTTMNQLRYVHNERNMEKIKIQEYLGRKRVSLDLSARIWHFFKQKYDIRKRHSHLADILFFAELPVSLRMELHTQIYGQTLLSHQAFYRYALMRPSSLSSVCHAAMRDLFYKPQQDIFLDGRSATDVFFVMSGLLNYHSRFFDGERPVLETHCISEPVLWIRWTHRGWLVADTSCELVAMEATKFHSVVSEHAEFGDISLRCLRRYAIFFQEAALTAEEQSQHGGILTDLPADAAVTEELTSRAFGDISGLSSQTTIQPSGTGLQSLAQGLLDVMQSLQRQIGPVSGGVGLSHAVPDKLVVETARAVAAAAEEEHAAGPQDDESFEL